jgi:uncharacterized protein (TIGR02246 family)
MRCGSSQIVKAATPDPETVIAAMLQTQQSAWNANDNATYGSVYTHDADFINIRGQIFMGRAAITQVHGMIFAGPFKGSAIKITIRLYKVLAQGVVLVDTDQEVTNFAVRPPGIVPTATGTLLTHFKYIAALQADGSWKFISGQNTSALPS